MLQVRRDNTPFVDDSDATLSDEEHDGKQVPEDGIGVHDTFVGQGAPHLGESHHTAPSEAHASVERLVLTPNLVSAATLFAPASSRQDGDAAEGNASGASEDLGKTP